MIPIYWTQRTTIPHLDELLAQVREQGGSIIQYQRVFSIILYSQSSPQFEWVPSGASRVSAGLKHTLFSALLGWWSLTGLFWTPAVIINNLMGGVDVTRVLTEPPPLPGQPFDSSALAELARAQKRQQIAFLILLFIVLAVVIGVCVVPTFL